MAEREPTRTSWRRRLPWRHGPHCISSLLGAIGAEDSESVARAVTTGGDPLARGGEPLALANRVVRRSRSATAVRILGWLLDFSRRQGVSGADVLALPAFAPRSPPPPRYRGRGGRILSPAQSRRVHALKRKRLAKLSAPFFNTFHRPGESDGLANDGILLIAEALWPTRLFQAQFQGSGARSLEQAPPRVLPAL